MTKTAASIALEKRRDSLVPHIVQVSSHVWVSVAEDVSNVCMIVGSDGIVLIDTGMIPECAERTLARFREITDLPIRSIIYTHGHGDHTGGSPVFCAEGSRPEIWARDNFGIEAEPFVRAGLMPLFKARGAKQGGFLLPPDKRICNGIAPVRYPRAKGAVFAGKTGAVPPDHFFSGERMTYECSGLTLEFIRTDGETEDGMSVWFQAEGVLFCGDALYRSFPNVYPVRGTGKRDIQAWCSSLNLLREFGAEVLVPGHTDPFIGKSAVHETLANYEKALDWIFRKTVEGMNEGKTPDRLAREIRLPAELAGLDYLEEVYGNVSWTVRNIFNGILGWFDGNPLHLAEDFGPREEALHIAELAGGERPLYEKGILALRDGDAAWAARVADHLLALDPENPDYLLLKADALDVIAEGILTATGRNFAFTSARQLRSKAENLQPH